MVKNLIEVKEGYTSICRAPDNSSEDKEELKLPYPERVSRRLKTRICNESPSELVIDVVGIHVSIANALRRIMLAEVPTIAFEEAHIGMNSSILHDEVLAHRLGLIPIDIDPRLFRCLDDTPDDYNTLVFMLNVNGDGPPEGEVVEAGQPYTKHIYSRDLQWDPDPCKDGGLTQRQRFPDGIGPVHDDILLAKLRRGQCIKVELHAHKGIGKDHAKFSPVATAAYRLMPVVTLKEPIEGEVAKGLVNTCPMGVFDIEDSVGKTMKVPRAYVKDPRRCSMCRECLRGEDPWTKLVSLGRVSDHFIFSIEAVTRDEGRRKATGMLTAREVLRESMKVLKQKCDEFLNLAEEHEQSSSVENNFWVT